MKYVKGDILQTKAMYVLHGVNCQGVMGSGVAKAIREKWPKVFAEYQHMVETEMMKKDAHPYQLLGKFQEVQLDQSGLFADQHPHTIVNLFTQENYGYDGRAYADLNAINSSLLDWSRSLPIVRGWYSAAIPKIGCGLGGCEWHDVKRIVDRVEEMTQVKFMVYEL